MAKTQTRVSVKDAATKILSELPLLETMPLKDLAEKIMATKGVKLEGKTPVATIRKTLDRSPDFVRPKPGMYRLDGLTRSELEREADGETDEPAGDEFAVDLKEAAKAADQKASTAKRKPAAKPDPKPSGRKPRAKASA